jgi:hypothetical protein
MLQELRQGTVNGCGSDDVIIIEHEHEILSLPAEKVIGEQGQYGCEFHRLCEAKPRLSARAQVGIKPLQGGNEIGEEPNGLIVLRLKREPGDQRACGSPPLGQQGRFAVSGRCRDKGERACHALLETLDEVRARDELRARAGQMQLGGEQEVVRILVALVQDVWGS